MNVLSLAFWCFHGVNKNIKSDEDEKQNTNIWLVFGRISFKLLHSSQTTPDSNNKLQTQPLCLILLHVWFYCTFYLFYKIIISLLNRKVSSKCCYQYLLILFSGSNSSYHSKHLMTLLNLCCMTNKTSFIHSWYLKFSCLQSFSCLTNEKNNCQKNLREEIFDCFFFLSKKDKYQSRVLWGSSGIRWSIT